MDNRILELGLVLPPPFRPTGIFRPVIIDAGTAYVAGHGPLLTNGEMIKGRVGIDLDFNEAVLAARQTGLSLLSTLRSELGSLDRIRRIAKALVMLNCTPDFTRHPGVADGFSALFAQVFGEERGVAARSAVGMSSLPGGIPVEIELVVGIN